MWFDSSSIANLAKNALKEAQKHIDNVLDIKEDQETESISDDCKIVKSKTMSSINENINKEEGSKEVSGWESFNENFYEDKSTSSHPVTNPPLVICDRSSESLDIISRTPSSLPSPLDQQDSNSRSILHLSGPNSGDDSVEIINKTLSIVEMSSSSQCSPERTESIEDDISNINMSPDEVSSSNPTTILPSKVILANQQDIDGTANTLSLSDNTLTNSETDSFYDPSKEELDQAAKTTTNVMDKSIESFEIQTQVSDSTHSFEEIQHPSKAKLFTDVAKCDERKESSGDELETATSSDIEIISSPNCDSSSTNSCSKISPKSDFPYQNSDLLLEDLNLDRKGHSRELSEVSVLSLISDESLGSPVETEKLLKRISELMETLEQREYKMVQMGRSNAELVEINARLTNELDGTRRNCNSLEMTNVQEEYTQRLSALEKKFQQSIRDNGSLKKQLETLKSEMSTMVNRIDYEKFTSEKDFVIEALKSEGEKLSKQILQHSNVIKKLRFKLKEDEEKLKMQSDEIAQLTEDNQKYKKTLATREEIEKSQNEGINKLTTEKRRLEKENQQLKSQNEDFREKLAVLQTSFDVLKKESSEKSDEIVKNLEVKLDNEKDKNQQIMRELSDLRLKIREIESLAIAREQKLRQENIDLKQKLEETEFRIEDQKQEASLSSIPLIKQLESLQTTLNVRSKHWESQERTLLDKLEVSEHQLSSHLETERNTKDQFTHLHLKISNLEEKLSKANLKVEQSTGQLQQKEIEFNLHENENKLKIDQLKMELSTKSNDIENLKILLTETEEKLRILREEYDKDKKKLSLNLHQDHRSFHHIEHQESQEHEQQGNSSPVPSLGSIESLHSSHPWNKDFNEPGFNSIYSSQYGGVVSSTSLMEGLQSVLKQREGEIQQLQWEINRLQTEKNFLSDEISTLTVELEKLTEEIKDYALKQEKFEEVQIHYDAVLEMFGQKVEEYEELKLDLEDLKTISHIQKTQIDDLTQKLNDIKPT
ncbi:CLUMA_CG006321, isoform A [Clunio marinus]|uniref:CLUMA_CG006321, isoform A n=1 Tax=Clunio marinus TaxID=568069 RepID=A0A1J1HXK0_9DIPT|nr:CLUMA_CG006321, isoform A [Clunio marinus]